MIALFEVIKVIGLDVRRGRERYKESEDLREREKETERQRERREKKGTGRDRGEISDKETASLTRSLSFRRVF